MSPSGRRRGNTGAFRDHPCLDRDEPYAMETPGMSQFYKFCIGSTANVYRPVHLAKNDPCPTTNSLKNVINSFSCRKVSRFIEKRS